ncbi:glycine, alanine and asparagine-rich protein-like [Saccostrea echinata]|uniref:glycine, alanine and asparagine-rich protein-like n=1 Tax=Saccostrea echinata TaxID=191078 RepID=UPI002A837840|nr:glycine, alanine and asparagine-rich protein-like [Saccostrea echinata]
MLELVKCIIFWSLLIGCVYGQLKFPSSGVIVPLGHDLLSGNSPDSFPSTLHFQMPTQDLMTELATEGSSVAGLRQKLLERLLINNQLQQMAGQGLGSTMDIGGGSLAASSLGSGLNGGLVTGGGLSSSGLGLMDSSSLLGRGAQTPSLNIASLLDSMSSPRAQISQPSNTKVLTRTAAIQSLQRRLDALRGNQLPETQGLMKSGIGFQTPTRDQSLKENIIRQTRKETPNASVKITVKRTTKTSGTGKTSKTNTPPMIPAATDSFSAASLLNNIPRTPTIFQSAPVARAQPAKVPQIQSPSTALVQKTLPTPVSQTANLAAASAAGAASAINSVSSVAAAKSMQNQISDMMDTRMDMIGDMAEAGMLGGGMMGLGGLSAMNSLGGLGGMGNMGGLSSMGGFGAMGMGDMMGGLGGMGMGGLGMGGLGMGNALMGGGLGGMMGGGLGGLGMMAAFS